MKEYKYCNGDRVVAILDSIDGYNPSWYPRKGSLGTVMIDTRSGPGVLWDGFDLIYFMNPSWIAPFTMYTTVDEDEDPGDIPDITDLYV